MFFIYGTKYLGGVKNYHGQEIQTKFAHFCFMPLFPVEGDSLLVTEAGFGTRKGIYMKLNNTSVLAGYGRMWMIGFTIGAFALASESGMAAWLIVALAFAAFTLYLMMFYGKNTPEEIEERELIGSMTGIYARAEWLSDNICDTIYCRMRDAYASEGRDWKADLRNGMVTDPKLIYVMAMLNNAYMPGEENFELRMKAAEAYAASLN